MQYILQFYDCESQCCLGTLMCGKLPCGNFLMEKVYKITCNAPLKEILRWNFWCLCKVTASSLQGPDASQPMHENQRDFSFGTLDFTYICMGSGPNLELEMDFMSSLLILWVFNSWKWDHEAFLNRFKYNNKYLYTYKIQYTEHYWKSGIIHDTTGGHRFSLGLQ